MGTVAEGPGELFGEEDPMQAPVLVVGARGAVERGALIDAVAEATASRTAAVQAFDPEAVFGRAHLEAAARRALRSHAEGRAIARDLAVEIALYAAGTTQIDDALATVGVPAQADAIVLAAVGDQRDAAVDAVLQALDLEREDELVRKRAGALDRLDIPQAAREAVRGDELELLVIEHVALLDARA